jgi:hypothetical protein
MTSKAVLLIILSCIVIGFIPRVDAQPSPPQFVVAPYTSPGPNSPYFPTGAITPQDNATVWANVSSSIGIQNVTIYYRISRPVTRFNSTTDFVKRSMTWWSRWLAGSNGLWNYTFKEQPNGTVIYYYLDVYDTSGQNTPWRNYLVPGSVQVLTPGPSDIYFLVLSLNDILLNERYQSANVTALLGAFLPYRPPHYDEPYYIQIPVTSALRGLTIFENSERFYYQGSVSDNLPFAEGTPHDAPYDVYKLDILFTIPYHVEKASGLSYRIPMTIRQFPGWDTWNVSLDYQGIRWKGNDTTELELIYTLSRLVPTYYPPLVLLLTTMAILGLTPFVSHFYSTRRFDVFLTAIILAASAELSDSINPLGGFLQSGLFSRLFAFAMAGTVVLIILYSSQAGSSTRFTPPYWFRAVATLATLLIIAVYFAMTTNLPAPAKVWLIGCSVFGSAITLGLMLRERYLNRRSQLHSRNHLPPVNHPI